jgi:hypothetical protein
MWNLVEEENAKLKEELNHVHESPLVEYMATQMEDVCSIE